MLLFLLKEYVKPQQTKFLIHPTEDGINKEVTVELELRSVANDTLREATLVPTISVEEQTHQKDTIVPPPCPSSSAINKLQGDWATRDRSIFSSPSQQHKLPGSRPHSRRGSNASETDSDTVSQHTWANRVEKTPEKLPIQMSSALEKFQKEPSPYRSTPTNENGGSQIILATSDHKGSAVNRRHSYEPTIARRGGHPSEYKRVISSPNLMAMQTSGRPKSQGYKYRQGGSYNKAPRSYKGQQSHDVGRDSWSTVHPPTEQVETTDHYRVQPGGLAYNRSQSDTRGIPPSTKEPSSVRSEPTNHISAGATGGWTQVKRKSTKPKNHPPSTKGKSNPKDHSRHRW